MESSTNLQSGCIRWDGEGIGLPIAQLSEVLGGIGKYASQAGFQATQVNSWNADSFNFEGSMHDPFDAKASCRRAVLPGSEWDVPPSSAASITLLRDGLPVPLNLSFCEYPEWCTVRKRGEEPVRFATNIPAGAHINGSISTASAIKAGEDFLAETQNAILFVLHKLAERVSGINVVDFTGYARHKNPSRLKKRLHNHLCLQAYEAGKALDADQSLNRTDLAKKFPVLVFPDFETYEMEGQTLVMKEHGQS